MSERVVDEQILEERENDVQELADKVEQLVQELTDRKAELATSDEEIDALTHDLQKVSTPLIRFYRVELTQLLSIYSSELRSSRSRRNSIRGTRRFRILIANSKRSRRNWKTSNLFMIKSSSLSKMYVLLSYDLYGKS